MWLYLTPRSNEDSQMNTVYKMLIIGPRVLGCEPNLEVVFTFRSCRNSNNHISKL